MSILNTAQRNAIYAAINAGAQLNKSMAIIFTQHNTQAERSRILWEAAAVVAEAYSNMGDVTVQAYASRKGDSIAFGTLMEDGSRTRTPESNAARVWFSRNILNAGLIKVERPTPQFSKVDRLIASYNRMDAAEQRQFRKLMGW